MENLRIISPFVSNGIASTEKNNDYKVMKNKDNSSIKISSRNDRKEMNTLQASLTP